jgi:hypothetical protein
MKMGTVLFPPAVPVPSDSDLVPRDYRIRESHRRVGETLLSV